jgi:hypothetical protein
MYEHENFLRKLACVGAGHPTEPNVRLLARAHRHCGASYSVRSSSDLIAMAGAGGSVWAVRMWAGACGHTDAGAMNLCPYRADALRRDVADAQPLTSYFFTLLPLTSYLLPLASYLLLVG